MNEKNITIKEINQFLDAHPDKAFSAAKLQYSLYLEPEIEKQVKEKAQAIAKTEEDLQYETALADTNDSEELLRFMRKKLSGLNRDALRKKLIQNEEQMLSLIQKKSMTNGQDVFIENALYFFLHCKENCCDWIMKEYTNLRSEYLKSSLCLVLGFRGTLDAVPFLMQETVRFEKEYPNEDYEQAPLLAVQELGVRFFD